MEPAGEPPHDLLASLREGHEAAWESLVRDSSGRLLAVARRILGDESDAEEAVQEAFVAAYRNLGQFDGRAAITTWLHRITVNSALSQRRRREPVVSTDATRARPAAAAAAGGEAAYEPAEQADLARVLWAAVADLAEEQRVVLVLRDVEQLSSREVAEALGLSDSAVRQRLHRARQAVAERLRPELAHGARVDCGGRLDLLFDAIDGGLTEDLQEPVHRHLAACLNCQALRGGYEWTLAALRSAADPDAPAPQANRGADARHAPPREAPAAIARIVAALKRERAGS